MLTIKYKGTFTNPNPETIRESEAYALLYILQASTFFEGNDANVVQNDISRIYITKTIHPDPVFPDFPHSIEITGPENEMSIIVDWIHDNIG